MAKFLSNYYDAFSMKTTVTFQRLLQFKSLIDHCWSFFWPFFTFVFSNRNFSLDEISRRSVLMLLLEQLSLRQDEVSNVIIKFAFMVWQIDAISTMFFLVNQHVVNIILNNKYNKLVTNNKQCIKQLYDASNNCLSRKSCEFHMQ